VTPIKKLKSITDIKNELSILKKDFEDFSPSAMTDFIASYSEDQRKGVVNLLINADKYSQAYAKELVRVDNMLAYERQAMVHGYVGGIDEAGRGPLAGPVVAACVILNPKDPILYANDSKKLSETMRNRLFDRIKDRAIAFGIGIVSEDDIDEINILQATYKAMRMAIEQMKVQPDALLNDAVIIPKVSLPQEKIIKGDAKSLSIASASILAKVTRDRIMVEYDKLFPEYGFAGHKGYGSAEHIKAIKAYGPCPIHRRSFIKNFV